jgi:Big-like domain-containing protein/collagen triple helix repeat protein
MKSFVSVIAFCSLAAACGTSSAPSGSPGAAGASGSSGASGAAGAADTSGASGAAGAANTAGASGAAGAAGTSGASGADTAGASGAADESDPSASTTTLTSSLNPSVFGQQITLSATVASGASATPSGTVSFFDGTASLGEPVALSASAATLETSALSVAHHALTAVYSGDAASKTSTSAALAQIVNLATPTVTISVSQPSGPGSNVQFLVNVTGAPDATPTGTVQVTAQGSAAIIASCTLSAQTSVLAECSAGGAAGPGSTNFVATYSGDSHYALASVVSSPIMVQ